MIDSTPVQVPDATWAVPTPPNTVNDDGVENETSKDTTGKDTPDTSARTEGKFEGASRRPSKEEQDAAADNPMVTLDSMGHTVTINKTRQSARRTSDDVKAMAISVELEQSDSFQDQLIRKLRFLLANVVFQGISMSALGFALFGGPCFSLFDIADEPAGTTMLDTLMLCVTIFFICETIIECVCNKKYFLSFFFCMDILGTVSMIFEISFLLGPQGKIYESSSQVDGVLLRSARAAKIGARAARLTKLVKCLTFFRRRKESKSEIISDHDAHALKNRLTTSLSTKVAMLTLALVIGIPILRAWNYPTEDLSMSTWTRTLEMDYARAYNVLRLNPSLTSTDLFKDTVEEMVLFYADVSYQPFELKGYEENLVIDGRSVSIPGSSIVVGQRPKRAQGIRLQGAELSGEIRKACVANPTFSFCKDHSKASIYFDFTIILQLDAATDILMIVFVIFAMVIVSFILSHTLDDLVVGPIERMCGTIQMMGSLLYKVELRTTDQDDYMMDDDYITSKGQTSDAMMLERVIKRLRRLTKDFEAVVKEDIAATDVEGQGILQDILQMDTNSGSMPLVSEFIPQVDAEGRCVDVQVVVQDLPVPASVIESWDLELLPMEVSDTFKVLQYIFFDSSIGRKTGKIWTDPRTFQLFHEKVKDGYLDNPYHNYKHACDVVSVVFKVCNQVQASEWMSDIDLYALLISALCHDIGHPGRTTPFLVETQHDLALRYNDKSPLENMHCANLFAICASSRSSNAFKKFDKDAYKQARKVCINSILHTDNALHFELVKQVQTVYNSTSDICDEQAKQTNFTPEYLDEVLYKENTLWQKLILHMSDVATPLKPFKISRAWATLVQDEFFAQGDEEKRLGLPVGMLNDRDKVSRTGAEHGFITFLVAPLVIAAVGNFPPLLNLADRMVENLGEWKKLWVDDVKPPVEDVKRREADIAKFRDQVDTLQKRGMASRKDVGLASSTLAASTGLARSFTQFHRNAA